MNTFSTTSEAYLTTLQTVLDEPDFVCRPRGLPCRELMNWLFKVERPVSSPIVTASERRNAQIAKYQAAETRLYLAGELSAEVWAAEASKFWAKIANDDGTINSNYGWLALYNRSLPDGLTPWEWAKRSLTEDPDSRQGYVRFSLPSHQRFGTKDQVCTMHLMFILRNERLHATTVMRSNDVVRGLVYDMLWFCLLLERMAGELGVGVGTYSHLAHSLHLYERDIGVAREMLGRVG